MNQDKLEVFKQEMAKVNVYILGIRELKWTGMGEFNSDDHLLLWARILQKKWNSHHSQQEAEIQYLDAVPKRFQGKPLNITVIQVYALTNNAEEAEVEWFYEDLQDLLELTLPKDVLFIIGDWKQKQEVKKHLE